jgi:hypothetical protein
VTHTAGPLNVDNAINKIFTDTLARMREVPSELGRYHAVRDAMAALDCFGDAATEVRDRISDIAIDLHNLDPDGVQTAMAQGVDQARRAKAAKRPRPELALNHKNAELDLRAIAEGTKPSGWRTDLVSAHDLYDQQFPDLRYVIPGLIPEGVTMLASRPKLGKSWMLLQVGHAVATGVSTLVPSDTPVAGDVLYLALEDSARRLKRRLQKFCGNNKEAWPRRLKLKTKWRRLDDGGLDDLREWCRSVEKSTLILIDILALVRKPKGKGQTDYEADHEACRGLQDLAAEFQLGIIVAHHDRKMDADDVFDTVSGTLGLTGGVDAIAIMKKKAGSVTLHIRGRDLPDDVEKAIAFDRETCRWMILGEAADIQRSNQRQRVLNALAAAPDGMRVTEITGAASMTSRNATDNLLFHMLEDGEVTRIKHGVYALPNIPLTANHAKNTKKQRPVLSTLKNQEDTTQSLNLSTLSEPLQQPEPN